MGENTKMGMVSTSDEMRWTLPSSTHISSGWSVALSGKLWFAMSPHGVYVRPENAEGWTSIAEARAAVEGLVACRLRIVYDLDRHGLMTDEFGRAVPWAAADPVVCPGCYSVDEEPCAPDCIDNELSDFDFDGFFGE